MSQSSTSSAAGPIPTALVLPAKAIRATRLWWVTLAAVIGAIVLLVMSLKGHGPTISIHFAEGHGLKAGDVLRFRGIAIGDVTDVVLTPDLGRVSVQVRLEPKAAHVARRGSQFWIERPRVSLSRVSGLETVVGAKSLGVIPGPSDGPVVAVFDGIETPPTLNEAESLEITIRFREGHGLQVGDTLRHRGIAVGEVVTVALNHELSSVAVRVRLVGEAHHLAREGTRFWVERPRVSVAEVRGLETLVGGRYLAVMPGPEESPSCAEFDGLDTAPVAEVPAGALQIVLHAPQRWGVERGVPVTYRGLQVGQVLSVGLSSDGTSLEAHAYVESRYRSLVRQNSLFWSSSGVDMSVGLTGIQFTADTLTSIAQGGVAFATPPEPGSPANTGQRFAYTKSPKDEWLSWQPRIASSDAALPTNSSLPVPQRAVARWAERSFGFRRERERAGWLLLLSNGQLLGPADVLLPTTNALGPIRLEVAGQDLVLVAERIERLGSLALFRPAEFPADSITAWPTANIRRAVSDPEDCLAITDSQSQPIPIAASSLHPRDHVWDIRSTTGLSSVHHGAVVVSTKDGQVIGQLLLDRGKASISPIGQ
ncbi:MAG: MlaD family protein [Planctomycetaceae bacterium]